MKVKSKIFYLYVAFVVAYLLLTFLPAPDPATLARYHLGSVGLRLLDITVVIPMIGIWFAAFYGYQKLHNYSAAIRTNKDGKQTVRLSWGLLVMALGLPLNSLISGALLLIARHNPGFVNTATIISNYLNVLYPLAAFMLISMGARGLSEIAKSRPPLRALNSVALVVIVLGVVLCNLIARAHHDIRTYFHLSYSVVMFTLAIPYMFTWFLGLFAAAELYVYSKKVAGIVYRKAWKHLSLGLGFFILINIVFQYISTLSSWVTSLTLAQLLLLLYVLLLLFAGVFIIIALGAKQLMKIEEA